LYTCLRSVVRALRPLVRDDLWLFADRRGAPTTTVESVSSVMDGAKVRLMPRTGLMRRAFAYTSVWPSLDVFLHNLHGGLPRSRRAANVYLVPDVIPLAFDYGVPGFVDAYRPFYEEAVRHGDAILVFSEHAKADLLARVGGDGDFVHVAPLAAGPEFRPADATALRSALVRLGLADGPYVLDVVRRTGGAVADAGDAEIVEGIRLLAATEGIFGETAVGTTLAVLRTLIRSGQLDPGAETVIINSGDGLKTLDAVASAAPAGPPIRPRLADFEAFEARRAGAAA